MKLKYLFPMVYALYSGLSYSAEPPVFYVVDLRHTGDAILYSTSQLPVPRSGLQYVVVDTQGARCCFHPGSRSGQRKSLLKIDEGAPALSSEEGDKIFQTIGFANIASTAGGTDTLAVGVSRMLSVTSRGRRTYEFATDSRENVIVRHCLGVEGVNFRLYRSIKAKIPYASYYFALGYSVKPDCH